MYVYKEVWVHSTSRWLWMMQDLLDSKTARSSDRGAPEVSVATPSNSVVIIRLTTSDPHVQTFTLRAENLVVDRPTRTVTRRAGAPVTIEWKAQRAVGNVPWVAVVIPDGDFARRREVLDPVLNTRSYK